MKKLIFALALLTCSVAVYSQDSAQDFEENRKSVYFDAGLGVHLNLLPTPKTGWWLTDMSMMFLEVRAGFFGSALYPINENFSVGPELGIYFAIVPFSLQGGTDIDSIGSNGMGLVFDVPLNLMLSAKFGDFSLKAFGGAVMFCDIPIDFEALMPPDPYSLYSTPKPAPKATFYADAGARLGFGFFYVEGAYIFTFKEGQELARPGLRNYYRMGLGLSFTI